MTAPSSQNLLLPIQQIFSNLGIVGSGYKVYTYTTGTTTPLTTYSNIGLTIPNTYPLTSLSTGRFATQAWVMNKNLVKIILTDGNDVVLGTYDPIDNFSNNNLNTFNPIPAVYIGTTTGTTTAYALTSLIDISQVGYSSNDVFIVTFDQACGAAPTLSIDGLSALPLVKYTGVGTTTPLIPGDLQNGKYFITVSGSNIVVFNPEHPANLQANTTIWRGLTYLPTAITIANDVSTPNTKIDFSGGVFQFSDGSGQAVASAWTKTTGAWVAGNGNGGLDTGSVAINTWYHSYAIYNPTTHASDYIFSTNASSPTLPTGYTKYKRLRASQIFTDGSANIIPSFSDGIQTSWVTVRQDIAVTNPGTSAVLRTLSIPLGIKTYPIAQYTYFESTAPVGAIYGLVTSPQQTDSTPSSSLYTWNGGPDLPGSVFSGLVQSNTSSQIRTRLAGSGASSNIVITTSGWIDNNIYS